MSNLLLIEDERYQVESLIKIIQELSLDINIFHADSEAKGLEILNKVPIDFFYIDIELKEGSGISLANKIRMIDKYKLAWIIFITSNSSYMLNAFKKIHCYDYIIKPIKKDKIQNMTKLLHENSYAKEDNETKLDKQYVVFESRGVRLKFYIDEIVFIEVKIRTLTVYTKFGVYEIDKLSLKKALEKINSEDIVQSHRAYAVNKKYIKEIRQISVTSSEIYFRGCEDKAYLGSKFKLNFENI